MSHWASASNAWLLLECSFPWDQTVEREESSEPANYGSAFHALLAELLRGNKLKVSTFTRVAERYDVGKSTLELMSHVKTSHVYFAQWLRRNEFGLTWLPERALIEQAVALLPLKNGRIIPPHDADHKYSNLEPGEIPGTLDYANMGTTLLVIDHKTGEEDFSDPLSKPQLLVLAAAMMRESNRKECIVGVLHARRRGLPKMYAERVSLKDIEPVEMKLAVALSRIGDGSLRPGAWCGRCPLSASCRARDGQLLERGSAMLGSLTVVGDAVARSDETIAKLTAHMTAEQRDGVLYELAQLAEKLSKRVRQELRMRLAANPGYLPETRKGEYLTLREQEKESVSKSSIIEAFGKVAGERELTRLREKGAIKKIKVPSLHLEKERGR